MASLDEALYECPMCKRKYDSQKRRPYLLAECGHSMCDRCSAPPTSSRQRRMSCATCSASFYTDSDDDHRVINFALLDLLEAKRREKDDQVKELQTAKEQLKELEALRKANDLQKAIVDDLRKTLDKVKREQALKEVTEMTCSLCDQKENRKRMRICFGCAAKNGVGEDAHRDQIADYTMCGLCAYDSHKEHKIAHYVPWKKEEYIRTAADQGKSQTTSMFELCSSEMNKGKELLDTFHQTLSGMKNVKTDKCELEEFQQLSEQMQRETTKVTDILDANLGSLRRVNKTVETSITSLRSEFEADEKPSIKEEPSI